MPSNASGPDSLRAAQLPALVGDVQPQPLEQLVDQLLDRWHGKGAPRNVLSKAAQVDREFRTRHAAVRHDREFISNCAFLIAFLGGLSAVTLGITLAELPILTGERVARMVVLALMVGASVSVATRTSNRLAMQLAILGGFALILFTGAPSDFALRGWDRTTTMVGTALIAAKAVRLFLDRMLDRYEARLLLASAGCR
ncbi:hypothetical protein FJQ54_06540 [Sandaracinobacter neustonicus]|uniref:Uncharacterized protein n=1 Tax=Sandaracinobacter neustonicus TaxID=1715348 RepID=A0A501XP11_9SPHN|nr:hypothetical protein [Sandaracinobacter neustonicus]TPE62185.1 hypothetical protein FJQ54_06540 [Sandaracinobacter neustonicus]